MLNTVDKEEMIIEILYVHIMYALLLHVKIASTQYSRDATDVLNNGLRNVVWTIRTAPLIYSGQRRDDYRDIIYVHMHSIALLVHASTCKDNKHTQYSRDAIDVLGLNVIIGFRNVLYE